MAWTLTVHGKKAHSGFPHNGINPLPIAMEAVKAIVQYFNTLCPRCDKDDEYEFPSSSNMKPTVWEMSPGSSANQYADWARVTGDVRMTPFYDVFEIKTKILEFVETLDIHQLPKWHESFGTKLEDAGATLEFKWVFGPYCGIACDTSSSGYQLIQQATSLHHDSCSRCSDLGAVPLVRELQDSGIDIQIIGYGNSDAYHANNEYCTLSGMKKGFAILSSLLALANDD